MHRLIIPVTILFAMGILISSHLAIPLPVSLNLSLAGFVVSLVIFLCLRRAGPLALMGIFIFLGVFHMSAWEGKINSDPLNAWSDQVITLRGTVLEVEAKEDKITLRVRAQSVEKDSRECRIGSNVCVLVEGKELKCIPGCGDIIRVKGRLRSIHSFKNPGIYDYERHMALQGIRYRIKVESESQLHKQGRGYVNPLAMTAFILKKKMESVIYCNLPQQPASLLSGIVFGDKSGLPRELQESFRDTGTLHLLAASGMNVGILVSFVFFLFSRLKVPRRYASLCALPIIMIYTLMAGASACIVRASLMASFGILAILLDREHDLPNFLFMAAFVMLIKNPFTLFDIGFQLSFGAVIGIIYASPLLTKLFAHRNRMIKGLGELFFLSLGIQLVLAPVLAYHFNKVSLIGPFCNVFLVPPAGILLNMGLLEGILGAIFYPLSIPIAFLNKIILSLMIHLVTLFAACSFSTVDVSRPAPAAIVLYYLVLFLIYYYFLHGHWHPILFKRKLWISGFIALLIFALFRIPWRTELKAVFMDVGDGDAIWLSLPSGENLLIDGGPKVKDGFDAGEKLVIPLLRAKGVNRLDLAILSHPHDDHLGGMVSIAKEMEIGEFIMGKEESTDLNYLELRKVLYSKEIPTLIPSAGDELIFSCGAVLRILAPLSDHVSTGNANDDSLVAQLIYKEVKILLMGDLEVSGERELLAQDYDLSSDVIKLGHHGRDTSTSEDFLEGVSPSVAIISVGSTRFQGHPSPSVLARLSRRGVNVFRTDTDGAIILTTDGNRITVETCRKERRLTE